MFHLWPPVIHLVLLLLIILYTNAMDRILRGGLQHPGCAVRLHCPGQLRQESQEEPRARSGIEGRDYGPEGRQGYNSTTGHTFTTRYTVTYVAMYRQHAARHISVTSTR